MHNKELLGDVVASIIERVLMNTGIVPYAKMSRMLSEQGLAFSDCYGNPDVLRSGLEELFGSAQVGIVAKIRSEFRGMEDDNRGFERFLQKLGN